MSPRTVPSAFRSLACAVLFAAVFAAGCDDVTPISTVLADPAKYEKEKVTIAGKVTSAIGVLGSGLYEVEDGTGKLAVVSKGGGVPTEGSKVGVEGTMRTGFTIGTQSLTVLMEERRFTP